MGKKKVKLIYDIASCPMSAGITMDQVLKLYEKEDIVIYDSTENPGCRSPYILCVDESAKDDFRIVDLGKTDIQDLVNEINTRDDKEE